VVVEVIDEIVIAAREGEKSPPREGN